MESAREYEKIANIGNFDSNLAMVTLEGTKVQKLDHDRKLDAVCEMLPVSKFRAEQVIIAKVAIAVAIGMIAKMIMIIGIAIETATKMGAIGKMMAGRVWIMGGIIDIIIIGVITITITMKTNR